MEYPSSLARVSDPCPATVDRAGMMNDWRGFEIHAIEKESAGFLTTQYSFCFFFPD